MVSTVSIHTVAELTRAALERFPRCICNPKSTVRYPWTSSEGVSLWRWRYMCVPEIERLSLPERLLFWDVRRYPLMLRMHRGISSAVHTGTSLHKVSQQTVA